MDEVDRARAKRDAARDEYRESQAQLEAAIIVAASLGASLREIADRAGVSFQRISKIIQQSGGSFPST